MTSLAQSASPRMAKYHAAGDRKALRTLLWRLTMIGTLTGAAAIAVVVLAGRQILTLLYRPEYAGQTAVFIWIVVAVSLRYAYVFIGVVVTSMRRFVIQLLLRIGVFICLAAASPVLILRYGLVGGAIALVLVSALEGLAWVAIGYACVWRDHAQFPACSLDTAARAPATF